MSKHTPGPWEVNDVRVDTKAIKQDEHGDTSNMVALVYGRYVGENYSVGSQKANARLIAAAPDLLSALIECEEYFDQIADADCDQDGYIPNEEMKLLQVVRDALGKAGAR